ncbi:kielin/chordin-like protein [Salminus brasiliensis]|uniref:kielin/chordin-like protein n=1 Tax=Salminus brasiliensis TaxID=930266 RepID=UPI003B83068B
MELPVSLALLCAQLTLLTLCWSLQTQVDAQLQDNDENVIDLLEALNVPRSVRGVTKVKGREPGVQAWRLRSRTPHLTLPREFSLYLLSSSRGSLGLHLVGQQARNSEATLISLISEAAWQLDGRPLLSLSSSTRDNWLRLEYRSQDGQKPEVLTLPGENPFSGGEWVRMGLSLEPKRLQLFVECKEAMVVELEDQALNLEFPLDLQITFSSTAGNKTSKFSGYWQTAELSTKAYERRPWLCDNEKGIKKLPPVAQTFVEPDLDVVNDQPDRVAGTGLGPPGTPLEKVAPSEPAQPLTSIEHTLQSINTMLTMLKTQNKELQARVQYLESCECVRRTCTWEGREMEEGSRWSADSRTVCSCTSGKVQCVTSNDCRYKEQIYSNSQTFSPNPCSKCVCENGQINCEDVRCPSLSCSRTHVPQGSCCPDCQPGCEHEGALYAEGDVFVSRSNPCLSCTCSNSLVACNPTHCPPSPCANPHTRSGECCPSCSACDVGGQSRNGSFTTSDGCRSCTCRNGDASCVDVQRCPESNQCRDGVKPPFGNCCKDCSRCEYHGAIVQNGISFTDRRDPCRRCVCNGGNVDCNTQHCPSTDCALVETVGGECCPRCRSCFHEGAHRLHGSQWQHPQDRCSVCSCSEGQVECKRQGCDQRSCRDPSTPAPGPNCNGCSVNGRNYQNGEPVPSENQCEQCVCRVSGLLQHAGEVKCENRQSSCPRSCSHPVRRQGECCPTCDSCEFEGRVYADGVTFKAPGNGPCLKCTCERGNVRCQAEICPPALCSNPIRDPNTCCPHCKGCVSDGVEYNEGAQWNPKGAPCTECLCSGGKVSCGFRDCIPPPCQHPNLEPGACCPSCDHCLYNHRVYENGQTFFDPDRPCQRCTCQKGTVRCGEKSPAPTPCPPPSCSNPTTPPGNCCPRCADCLFEDHSFVNGQTFPNPRNPCEECVCSGGQVNCHQRCPRPNCHNPVSGTCCQNNCNGCSYAGKEYPNGMVFPHPTDRCRECHCTNGNVQCLAKRCAPTQCSDPRPPSPPCPAPPANCDYEGQKYRNTQRFHHPRDSCQTCSCTNGSVSCHRKPCPHVRCSHPILQECCRTCDGCLYDGVEHANGAAFADRSDPCGMCVCREGTVTCEKRRCPPIDCPYPVQGHCCQSCDGCYYAGVEYQNNQEFSDTADRCKQCVCTNGHVTCSRRPCFKSGCSHPVNLPGQCCPVCDGCFFNGVTLHDGQTIPNPTDPCSECTCRKGDVRCQTKRCPRALCSHPTVDLCGCKVCDDCNIHGRVYSHGEEFSDPQDPCKSCTCQNGNALCRQPQCPRVPCRRLVRRAGDCCPVCTGVCEYLGQEYESHTTFTPANDRCSTCTCLNEVVSCQRKPCAQQCSHPARNTDCCPVCDSCLYEGVEYASNTKPFEPRSDPCQQCVCERGSVRCATAVCAPVSCPSPVIPPGKCCPQCGACVHGSIVYREGQIWIPPDEPCNTCTCTAGIKSCASSLCAPLTCMHKVTDPQTCCPRCRGCVYDGVEHAEGSTWFASSSPCMSCMCVNGVTTCSEIQCLSPCVNKISVPGECCPLCADCVHGGRVYGPGENFHPSDDPCQICTCEVMPDGQQHLRCYRKQCPSLVDCPKHNIQFSGPDSCCPVCAQPLSNCTETLIGNEVLATDDPCFTCQCKDLTWTCIHKTCHPLSCPPDKQYTPPDSCCPVCDVCVVEEKQVSNGESWTDSEDECITCSCNMGHIECKIEECGPRICQEGLVKVKSPGKCCYECQDPNVQCVYEGQAYASNEHWAVDECTSCTCVSGDVHCQTERCPAVSCASDETPSLIPGMCCPHCIPRPATCIVFGDPHYRTFDGKMVNFQGACTYVLAQDCEGGDFSIHVTNDGRGRKGVSWTKEVTVYIGDVVVQLLQDWIVKVDYKVVSLPFLKEPYVYLERKTNTILLNTNIGMKVLWNGRSHLEVSVPGTYKEQMCGICGNFNNYPQDDMKLRNGQISNSEADFGNDWKVGSGNHSSGQCSDGESIEPCKKAGYSVRKAANSRCAVLKSPVFKPCHKVVPAEMFFASCVYDLCACGSNSDECLCDALEAYASECREGGVILNWRSPSLCAVGCPADRGYVFDECGPPCPKTCFNKDVPLGVIEAHCFKPCVPGCQCPAGLVEHEAHCIAPEKCPKIIYGSP